MGARELAHRRARASAARSHREATLRQAPAVPPRASATASTVSMATAARDAGAAGDRLHEHDARGRRADVDRPRGPVGRTAHGRDAADRRRGRRRDRRQPADRLRAEGSSRRMMPAACLDAGAAAVQVYTALIYEGPGLAGRLSREASPRRSPRWISTFGPRRSAPAGAGLARRRVLRPRGRGVQDVRRPVPGGDRWPTPEPVPSSPAAVPSLEGVVKRFGDVVAVDGVDLDVREGSSSRCSGRPAPGRPRACG